MSDNGIYGKTYICECGTAITLLPKELLKMSSEDIFKNWDPDSPLYDINNFREDSINSVGTEVKCEVCGRYFKLF